jgi:hypothetical protein
MPLPDAILIDTRLSEDAKIEKGHHFGWPHKLRALRFSVNLEDGNLEPGGWILLENCAGLEAISLCEVERAIITVAGTPVQLHGILKMKHALPILVGQSLLGTCGRRKNIASNDFL